MCCMRAAGGVDMLPCAGRGRCSVAAAQWHHSGECCWPRWQRSSDCWQRGRRGRVVGEGRTAGPRRPHGLALHCSAHPAQQQSAGTASKSTSPPTDTFINLSRISIVAIIARVKMIINISTKKKNRLKNAGAQESLLVREASTPKHDWITYTADRSIDRHSAAANWHRSEPTLL